MEDFDKKLDLLRRKQERCNHTSFKCPSCGLYQDNIRDKQRQKILILENKIAEYESLLTQFGICFIPIEEGKKCGMIELSVTQIEIKTDNL